MKIKIKNFGPVQSFELELKKLILFVGRNNSGKSYISLLFKIINNTFQDLSSELLDISQFSGIPYHLLKRDPYLFKLLRERRTLEKSLFDIEKIIDKINTEDSNKLIRDIVDKFKSLKSPHRSKVPIPYEIQNTTIIYLRRRITKKLEEIFYKNLTNKFTSKISDLISFDQKRSLIIIENKLFKFELSLNRSNKIDVNFEFIEIEQIFKDMKKPLRDIDNEIKNFSSLNTEDKKNIKISILYSTIKHILSEFIDVFDDFINKNFLTTIYLPATRSGLIQAYETIAMAYIQLAPETVTRKIEFPTLSGISADHINNLYKSQSDSSFTKYRDYIQRGKNFDEITKYIEDEILSGKIEFEVKKGKIRERISYMIKDKKIPLYRASSMVSELASLVIFLKNLLIPNDLLIFEEPESHLHPDSQVKIAKVIAKLVKNDLNLLITTHSDFLLQEINNYLKISTLPLEKVIDIYGEDLSIQADDVAINLFIRDDETNQTKVKMLEFDSFGLTEDIFYQITKELYQKSSIIDELINRVHEND